MPVAFPAWPNALRSRSLRLWSGSILGLYLLDHLVNVGLGLVSVAAMDAAGPWLGGFWHAPIGSALLTGALLVHFALSLRALYRRRTLRMTAREGCQLGFGLLLPFLLVSHVVGARIVPGLTDTPMTYADQVHTLWIGDPIAGMRQAAALVIAWAHGCFGFWFALRGRPWFPRWTWLLYPIVVLVPILALLGFAEAAREIVAYADVAAPVFRSLHDGVSPDGIRAWLYGCFAIPVAVVMAARAARYWFTLHRRIRVTYGDGRSVSVPRGSTVLEASRMGRVPHMSLCGGRGRCSTCRVRILHGTADLPAPSALERGTLARSGAAPHVRLACQLRPLHDVSVSPVFAALRPRLGAAAAMLSATSASRERELAVLFCDLRAFTQRAEAWLPFDTVFLLNRYFEMIGEAVEGAGGHLDKFIGDGALALFGLGTTPDVACRQALAAATEIARGLHAFNAEYAAELGTPLRIAMGVHAGAAIVGDMGHGTAVALTAVGDAVNVASRLEGEAKERDVEAVVSVAVMVGAGRSVAPREVHSIAVRGRAAPVLAILVPDATKAADPAAADVLA